ncbi:CPBP family intramembrane glutamic endopeptidase [Salinigranum sp. GCM10025319]|uniref:CPBP family intramembrane glutamic endopeptidase n=1 Tax=Salinigranum sp. GCM10025319 TaxID=3252687 RepID=UPI003608E7B2
MATILHRSRTLARSMRPWGFPLIYLGWAFLFWSPIIGSEESVWTGTNLVLFLVGGASPLIAGITMAWLTGGTERVHDIGRRLIDVRLIAPKWWLVVLLFWPVFDLLTAGAALALGVTDRPIDVGAAVLADLGALAFLVLLSFVLPAVEEVGLRGYYLDALQERFSPTVAGLLNGGTWAVWHAPFVYFPGYYATTTFNPELWWWLPSIVLQTLIFVWVYNNTRRSILAILVIHGMMNLTGELLGLAPELFPFQLPFLVLVAATLVVSWQRGTDTRPKDVAGAP